MIKNRKDYRVFLESDARAMGIDPKSRKSMLLAFFTNPRWRFLRKLRRVELLMNSRHILINKLLFPLAFYNYKRYGLKLGFSIPPNVCDAGLSLPHYGTIVISKESRIGKNCRIHICVNIGHSGAGAPVIGDNVYIGPGAKLFGNIRIGNNNQIGANAVVNKSFEANNLVIAGVPARIVKESSDSWCANNRLIHT